VACSQDREWFTLRIEPVPAGGTAGNNADARGLPFYLTFIVFPPGKYVVGSSDDEAGRRADERRHTIEITCPFALTDREVTWGQINAFYTTVLGVDRHGAFQQQFSRTLTLSEPVFGANWVEAVSYCRWLTKQAGMSDADQCYADPASLDNDTKGNPEMWQVDFGRHGFRLPTEAEWEVGSRSGMVSAYSFGGDAQLLAHYAWFGDNSQKWSHAVGQLRPSVRGLFDIHGNLWEWCHDWYGQYADDAVDPLGAPTGAHRVRRGGGWSDDAAACRPAYRGLNQPSYRDLGFRLAVVPFSPASE